MPAAFGYFLGPENITAPSADKNPPFDALATSSGWTLSSFLNVLFFQLIKPENPAIFIYLLKC